MKRIAIAAVLLLLTGCGGSDPKSPPEIAWGQDPCDFCHMIIEDQRTAAGYRVGTGEQQIFDDIGDMVYALGRESRNLASVWVRNYRQDEWLPAETAFLVESQAITTPMGYGLVACKTRAEAESIARSSGGTVLTWDQLRERGVKPPRVQ